MVNHLDIAHKFSIFILGICGAGERAVVAVGGGLKIEINFHNNNRCSVCV
jgi:hypothetical protein